TRLGRGIRLLVGVPLYQRAESRLDAIERGKDSVGSLEWTHVAETAFCKGKYWVSYKVYEEWLKNLPAWICDCPAGAWYDPPYYLSHRVCGARAAVLAAAGQGTDLKKPDVATRPLIRLQGLSWLQTELRRQRSWMKKPRLQTSING